MPYIVLVYIFASIAVLAFWITDPACRQARRIGRGVRLSRTRHSRL